MSVIGPWNRRFIVASTTATVVYAASIALTIYMVIDYKTWNPILEQISAWDVAFKNWLSSVARGTWAAEFATNEFREYFNLAHFLITLAVILTVGVLFGHLVNQHLGGTRSLSERFKISFWSLPWSIAIVTLFYAFKVLSPATFLWLIWAAHMGLVATRWFLKLFEWFPPIGYFLSFTLQRPFGHAIMFTAIGNMIAILILNVWYAIRGRAQ